MRTTVAAFAVASAFSALPSAAVAQAAGASPHSLTGNVALVSDYRFRGLTQTMKRPAFQGGFDYAHSSGFYAGNWNSNVSSTVFPNSNLEMDFYAGYKPSFGDIGLDFGILHYAYPGSLATLTNPQTGRTSTGRIDNTELYAGASWKFLSLKYSHAVSDFFAVPDTKGSSYLDGTATFDLGGGWGVVAHIGRQKVKNWSDASYSDLKLGVTKDIGGFVFGAAFIDTNAHDSAWTLADARRTMNIGKSGVVLSVAKTF